MKCKNCGAELREDTSFCHECGYPINKTNRSGDAYVMVTGSKIDLDEKTEIYQKTKELYYKAMTPPFRAIIPIIGLSVINNRIYEIEQVERKLLSFENQENIINAILTDVMETRLIKIRRKWENLRWLNIFLTVILVLIAVFYFTVILPLMSKFKSFSSFF